jgi:hypothetical protein
MPAFYKSSISIMSTFKSQLLAGLMICGGLFFPSASQAAACPTGSPGVPISTLASGFDCEFGGFNYLFDNRSQIGELDSTPSSALVFEMTPTSQSLKFTNLANASLVDFLYFVTPITEAALSIEQTFIQVPSGSVPFDNTLTTTPIFSPINPATMPFEVRATFEPDGAVLTELNHTMVKTPAPLPVLGASVAIGFSRKIRQRISRAG